MGLMLPRPALLLTHGEFATCTVEMRKTSLHEEFETLWLLWIAGFYKLTNKRKIISSKTKPVY